jgi:hypothetical protein
VTAPLRNIFACLVHERSESVVDLVRNLRRLDPESGVILYNGGRDSGLLERRFAAPGEPVFVHPDPRPLRWGALHEFALGSIELADEIGFDTLTFVDSDQLALRPGYSGRLAAHLEGRDGVGLLGNGSGTQGPRTRVAPAANAWREVQLWRPFLARFPKGVELWAQWTFWPSTVLLADAARDVLRLLRTDDQLVQTMARSRIWATEEIIIPTLVALLGYEVAASPCSYDFVRYRASYTTAQLGSALQRGDVYWMHPVPRPYHDPIRARIRTNFGHYAVSPTEGAPAMTVQQQGSRPLLRTAPILTRMRAVKGWFSDEEGDLLVAATARALEEHGPRPIVEIGSYCGRSTTVLASVVRIAAPQARVYAIDPHDGEVGALDAGIQRTGPTLAAFRAALAADGLEPFVHAIQQRSYQTHWDQPVALLLVDGLHDYANVSRDFHHFEPWLVGGAYVAFHDYASYYPGVVAFVDELLATGRWLTVDRAGSLIVLRRVEPVGARAALAVEEREQKPLDAGDTPAPLARGPLVSCVMPTCGRRRFVPLAIDWFLHQDHENLELIVVDDGPDPVDDLLPDDPRIRHVRLDRRHTIGAKRNLGAEAAHGEFVAHWDDDDWSSPHRISYQLRSLAESGADVCGLSRLLYLDIGGERAWRYAWRNVRDWVSDGTMLYSREFWTRRPLPDTNTGIDCGLLWTREWTKVAALADETFYVGTIHSGNTSRKQTRGALWRQEDPAVIAGLMGSDFDRYRAL